MGRPCLNITVAEIFFTMSLIRTLLWSCQMVGNKLKLFYSLSLSDGILISSFGSAASLTLGWASSSLKLEFNRSGFKSVSLASFRSNLGSP